ncbi:MAG TPA: UPF0158 family protein [Thermoanaerobaculia bacterium]|jgi:hypothetical protein
MPFEIDWEGLIVGFESRSHKITHFFDRETGDVVQVLEKDAARHAELSADARYSALPRDHGERSRGDLEEFAAHCGDASCRAELLESLQGGDPAVEFRRTLLRYPREEAHFFQFKERRAKERAREWLKTEGVVT